MAKRTVLDLTQDILSDLDADPVNSISDTEESLQVAQILQTTFYEIIDRDESWPHLGQMFKLEPSTDSTKPTQMQIPSSIEKVSAVLYDCRKTLSSKKAFREIEYREPLDFVKWTNQRDSTDANVLVVTTPAGVNLLVRNDGPPTCWTSFDDEYVFFDSYDADLETTLQRSKSQCHGYRYAEFSKEDDHVPDLPAEAFSYYLAEAKSKAFNVLKQAANPKEEQISQRQNRRLSQKKWRHNGGIRYPNYGRTPRK